ncbi:MAG: hypothetical protein U0893_09300 [Chloroflexota bacterium]
MRQIVVALLCFVSLVGPAPRPSTVLAHEPGVSLASFAVNTAPGFIGELSQIASPGVRQRAPSALVYSDPPATTDVLFKDELHKPELFWADTCTTGLSGGAYDAEGLHLRIAGRCYPGSGGAVLTVQQPDVMVGDGDARFEFRLEGAADRAVLGLDVWSPPQTHLLAVVGIAEDTVEIGMVKEGGSAALGQRQGIRAKLNPGGWNSLAMRKLGPTVWLMVNDSPFMQIEDGGQTIGAIRMLVSRNGPPDSPGEMTLSLRNVTVTGVAGADPARVPERQPRPVIDPRFERIITFIKKEIAEAPGDSAQAKELRSLGQSALAMLDDTQVNLVVGDLPEGTMAAYELAGRRIIVGDVLLGFTPHVATMLLLHEGLHAQQHKTGDPPGCVDREVAAYQWGSRLWRAWFGQNGKDPPGDEIEAQFTGLVRAENAGRLRDIVTERYRVQCQGR